MKGFYWSILLLTLLSSCQENLLDPDIGLEENLVVVDGWIYDTDGPHTVRISRSVAFESVINSIPINNAEVLIRDDLMRTIPLTLTGPGTYQTEEGIRGEVGRSYQVEVTLSTLEVYISDFTELRGVAEIDSLLLEEIIIMPTNQDIELEPSYFPVAFVQDPEEAGDFYRWRVARNGSFFNEPEDIVLQTDRFVNGNFFSNELKEYEFKATDTATVRLESITLETYNFLRFLRRQTTTLGTPSGTNPGTLSGNIQNRDNPSEVVLGYFGASARSEAEAIVTN